MRVYANGAPIPRHEHDALREFYMMGKTRGACELAEKAPLQILQSAILDRLVADIIKDPT